MSPDRAGYVKDGWLSCHYMSLPESEHNLSQPGTGTNLPPSSVVCSSISYIYLVHLQKGEGGKDVGQQGEIIVGSSIVDYMLLDTKPIFDREISRSCGLLTSNGNVAIWSLQLIDYTFQ
jgi:hypothetical protein